MAKSAGKSKEKSLPEKFKQFFGFKEVVPINFDHLKTEPYKINPEVVKELLPLNIVTHRLKALKELCDIVTTKRLEDNAIEMLVTNTKDLLEPHHTADTRHIVLQFYCYLIQGQLRKMTIMRRAFFGLIEKHKITDDSLMRLELLKALSENGKTVTYFEEEIGLFLFNWYPHMLKTGKAVEFLPLVINIIKFNAAYLDDQIVSGFVCFTCEHCARTSAEEEIQLCLEVMNAILCYSLLPSNVLANFLFALCLTVNIENLSQLSWKLMRNLLGTSMGHTTVFKLCQFIQDKKNQKCPLVLRGALCFMGMALWGAQKVDTLKHPPSAVLPSFLIALEYNNGTVAYEVAISLKRLIKKNSPYLQSLTWNVILSIIERLLRYPELQQRNLSTSPLATSVHDLLTAAEENCTAYCSDRLYKIVESCSDRRNDDSVIRLIQHRISNIHPIKEDFIQEITHLLEKYFKNEKRQVVQLKVIEALHDVRINNDYFLEDDLTDQTLLYYMSQTDTMKDVLVRKAVIDFLLKIAETSSTKRYFDILDVVEKVMKRHFSEIYGVSVDVGATASRTTYPDIEAAVCGLIKVFEKKLHTLPSNQCVRVFSMLVNHIQSHYSQLSHTEGNMKIRRMIMEFFFKIRSNSKMQVGLLADGKVEYSVYVSCTNSRDTSSENASNLVASPALSTSAVFSFFPVSLCFEDMFQILLTALKQEKDWLLLEMMFHELPKLLQNKALIISGNCNLNSLCSTLCLLITDKTYGDPENLHNVPPRFTGTDFRANVFPVVAALTAYHSQLETHMQRALIRCLQSGLVSKSAKVCIEGLSLCTLEMRSMLVKFLPAVLLKLSQISATVNVSVAVLEFLSNLIRLPSLYVSFVEDQYRSIFAIALPYTNYRKFNRYTVALAHHVIAMWFLKCRIPFRKEFSNFITKALRNNMSVSSNNNPSIQNSGKDGSAAGKTTTGSNTQDSGNESLQAELLEIGLDLMARFTFGMCSSAPKRSPEAEFLLEKGQKCNWVIGNRVVTVATSGCGTKAFKFGLCEKCYAVCRESCDSMETESSEGVLAPTPEPIDDLPPIGATTKERRRHRSDFHQRRSTLSYELRNSHNTKDDILIHRQSLNTELQFHRRSTHFVTKDIPETSHPEEVCSESKDKKPEGYQLCSCWCSGWAEIYVRGPTGNSSFIMKIQNHLFLPTSPPNIPLPAISSLLMSLTRRRNFSGNSQRSSIPEGSAHSSGNQDEQDFATNAGDVEEFISSATSEALTCPKPKVNLRRSNSSPDMNSGWLGSVGSFTVDEIYQRDPADSTLDMFDLEEKDELRDIEDGAANLRICDETTKPTHKNVKRNVSLELGLASASNTESSHVDSGTHSNAFRDRVHTISVMSRSNVAGAAPSTQRNKDMHRSGMSPSFVFLQLYHNSFFGSSPKPLLFRSTEQNTRSLKVLDHIYPYDTHKIGIIYVGLGQENDEVAILSNLYGSVRYVQLLRRIGKLIRLSGVDQERTYVGGLDVKGDDGEFALVWHDDVMRVAFHVATLMPNFKSEPKRHNKKIHIGNNFVTIVYNESEEDYDITTIKSQFTTACVIIRPEDFNSNVVTIKVRTDELRETFGHTDEYIVSDESLPIFVRQMALHANLASLILDPRSQPAHVSNWLARLHSIKRMRSKAIEDLKLKRETSSSDGQSDVFIDDFTDYV